MQLLPPHSGHTAEAVMASCAWLPISSIHCCCFSVAQAVSVSLPDSIMVLCSKSSQAGPSLSSGSALITRPQIFPATTNSVSFLALAVLYTCVCYLWKYVCACTCGGLSLTLETFLYSFPPYFLSLSLNLGLTDWLNWLASKSTDYCVCLPVLGLQVLVDISRLFFFLQKIFIYF